MKFSPSNCPHCEYDRRFPGFEAGGWMQQDNNGPIVSCPMCNPHAVHPFEPRASQHPQQHRATPAAPDALTPAQGHPE